MQSVEGEDEVLSLRNLEITVRKGSIRPQDEYFEFLDALCDPKEAFFPIQFQSNVGLANVALTSAGLTAVLVAHIACIVANGRRVLEDDWAWILTIWCFYMVSLCFYHLAEFLCVSRFNSGLASSQSFLVNHSRVYHIAVAASWVEFWVEALWFPAVKTNRWSTLAACTGLILVLAGQALRSGAMISAASNFTHLIQRKKCGSHRLITSGAYRYFRHPGYCGWFWWSIGTQILLGSPICFMLYFAMAFIFFKNRIAVEEATLMRFFPDEYSSYKARTWTGIPFIE